MIRLAQFNPDQNDFWDVPTAHFI